MLVKEDQRALAAPPPPADDMEEHTGLPPGWKYNIDAGGVVYYENEYSGVVCYTHPLLLYLKEVQKRVEDGRGYAVRVPPPYWMDFFDPLSRSTYYHNFVTGESTQDVPEGDWIMHQGELSWTEPPPDAAEHPALEAPVASHSEVMAAAVRIQAAYRGHAGRRRARAFQRALLEESAACIQSAFRAYLTRQALQQSGVVCIPPLVHELRRPPKPRRVFNMHGHTFRGPLAEQAPPPAPKRGRKKGPVPPAKGARRRPRRKAPPAPFPEGYDPRWMLPHEFKVYRPLRLQAAATASVPRIKPPEPPQDPDSPYLQPPAPGIQLARSRSALPSGAAYAASQPPLPPYLAFHAHHGMHPHPYPPQAGFAYPPQPYPPLAYPSTAPAPPEQYPPEEPPPHSRKGVPDVPGPWEGIEEIVGRAEDELKQLVRLYWDLRPYLGKEEPFRLFEILTAPPAPTPPPAPSAPQPPKRKITVWHPADPRRHNGTDIVTVPGTGESVLERMRRYQAEQAQSIALAKSSRSSWQAPLVREQARRVKGPVLAPAMRRMPLEQLDWLKAEAERQGRRFEDLVAAVERGSLSPPTSPRISPQRSAPSPPRSPGRAPAPPRRPPPGPAAAPPARTASPSLAPRFEVAPRSVNLPSGSVQEPIQLSVSGSAPRPFWGRELNPDGFRLKLGTLAVALAHGPVPVDASGRFGPVPATLQPGQALPPASYTLAYEGVHREPDALEVTHGAREPPQALPVLVQEAEGPVRAASASASAPGSDGDGGSRPPSVLSESQASRRPPRPARPAPPGLMQAPASRRRGRGRRRTRRSTRRRWASTAAARGRAAPRGPPSWPPRRRPSPPARPRARRPPAALLARLEPRAEAEGAPPSPRAPSAASESGAAAAEVAAVAAEAAAGAALEGPSEAEGAP
eukprot:tig00000743_g3880.t1